MTDPSNASFMGLYSTLTMKGWNDELCEAADVNQKLLPEIRDADCIGGFITRQAGSRFGLTPGTPMLTGIMDTSSALLLRGTHSGQLLNVCGSTDVLALCTDHPRPDEKLLTRRRRYREKMDADQHDRRGRLCHSLGEPGVVFRPERKCVS